MWENEFFTSIERIPETFQVQIKKNIYVFKSTLDKF